MHDVQVGETAEQSPAPGKRRGRRVVVVLVVLVVLAGVVFGGLQALLAYNRKQTDETFARAEREITEQANVGSWDEAKRALDAHAAALVKGDEKGWLAGVDPTNPKLVEKYRTLYANLHALGVSSWTYNARIPGVTTFGQSDVYNPVTVSYCLRRPACPAFTFGTAASGQEVHSLNQQLRLARRDGRYVITSAEEQKGGDVLPWQGKLVFAQGKRVTVGAPPSLAKRLPAVLKAADKAAVAADRYARYVKNPQSRYIVYLAGDAEWNGWFGGAPKRNAAGYAIPLALADTEVVLRDKAVRDPGFLAEATQHELGHVVTLSGSDQGYSAFYDVHEWLVEGVAEYIAYAPRPATDNPRSAFLREGRFPTSLAQEPLDKKASTDAGARFYGFGHLAVDCLAKKYGERAFFTFFVQVVRERSSYDRASRAVFRRPWKDVDRACVSSIRGQVL